MIGKAGLLAILLLAPHNAEAVSNCIYIEKVFRSPGSSASSSCSYNEPNRISVGVRFRNQCTSAIHAGFEFELDTGGTRTVKEYNVRPGQKRTTYKVCGAGKFVYWAEEAK